MNHFDHEYFIYRQYILDFKRWYLISPAHMKVQLGTILKQTLSSDPAILEYQHEDCWFNRYSTKVFRNLATVFRFVVVE